MRIFDHLIRDVLDVSAHHTEASKLVQVARS